MAHYSLMVLVIVLVFMVIVSAFFSGSEIGMMSLNRYRLKHLVNQKNRQAMRTAELLEKPERLLGVILIGNTFANIFASALATIIGQRLFGDIGVAIATTVLTLIILIFSEVTPKTLAALYPQQFAFYTSLVLKGLQTLLYPFVALTTTIANGLLRLMGVRVNRKRKDTLSSEELRTIVHEAGSLISSDHKNMLVSILDLEKATVEDIMIPKNEIHGIDLNASWQDILEKLETAQHTRLPIYEGSIDQVQGMIHVRSILKLIIEERLEKEQLIDYAEECYYVPEGTALHVQLLQFKKNKKRSCLIVDEYGEIQGLVTLEDILEEIVGEFTTDMAAVSKDIVVREDGSFLIDASINIRALNRSLNWQLPLQGPRTLSGLIVEHLGFIPPAQSCVKINGYPVEILLVKDNIIKTVCIDPKLIKVQD